MGWLKFSVAVVLTSAVLAVGMVGAGAFVVTNALASGLHDAGQTQVMQHGSLPPELAGLKDIPANQRFAHFKGLSVNLTDQNGQPLAISVIPGVVSATSATSVTVNGNDGATHTYAIDAQTNTHGPTANGQDVVVVTMNNSNTARAVIGFDPTTWQHK